MIDAMTLMEAETIFGYWQEHPPAHLAIAAGLGVKPAKAAARREPAPRASQILEVPGMRTGDPHEGLAAPVLDFQVLSERYRKSGRGR